MLKNYFNIAWRKIKKNRLYSFVNIVGLTAGLASCLLIGVYLKNELSFDNFHTNADRIARVVMLYSHGDNAQTTAVTGSKAGPQLKREFPEIEHFVRTYKSSSIIESNGEQYNERNVLYADPSFFKTFSFKLIDGIAGEVLSAPNRIVLSASTAKKYFNTFNVVGKTIKSDGKLYTVSGVAQDAPNNSQMHFDFVVPFVNLSFAQKEQWSSANYVTYLLLKSKSDFKTLQSRIDRYMAGVSKGELKMAGNDYMKLKLEPLTSVHLHSEISGFEPNGSLVYIYILFTVAALTLLIAAVNYTNLAVAQSAGRSGEISIRKVLGAGSWQLFCQFIGESFFFTTSAAIVAVVVAYILLPQFNNISGKSFTTVELLDPVMLIALILLSTLISFIAGAYPSLLLANVHLAKLLKSGFSFGSNSSVRQSLIIFQFVISFFLIISTTIIVNQLRYIQSKDVGYNRSNIISLPLNYTIPAAAIKSLKDQAQVIPGVKGISVANSSPVNVKWTDGIDGPDGKNVMVKCIPADKNFLDLFGLKLLSGSNFTDGDLAKMDTSDNGKNYRYSFIINESAAKSMGLTPENAIGKTISKQAPGTIKAVVKDFNFQSLHEAITPLVIFLDNNNTNNLFLKIDGNHTQQVLQSIETIWKREVNGRPFEYHFVDEDYNSLYVSEQRTAAIFKTFSLLAILLACLGLFALTAFSVLHRTKEIGIRKVLGASVTSITLMLSKNFIKLVLIAIVIATPLAWYTMDKWLQDFAYRIGIQWYVFVAAAAATVSIAFLTVSFQSVKAAISTPVKSLRSE